MKLKNHKYNIIYYICFLFTVSCTFISASLASIFDEGIFSIINVVLLLINIVLVILYSILLLQKRKFKADSLAFPILYLVFLFSVIFISIIYNDKLIVPYIQFNYYTSFILWNYILLNAYSLLLFTKKNKKKKKSSK